MEGLGPITDYKTQSLRLADSTVSAQAKVLEGKELGKEKLKEVADEFEAMFIKLVLQSMKETLDTKDSPFYGGMSEDIFSDMLYHEYADLMSKEHDLGLAENIISHYERYI